jgi:hypothetical protein
MPEKATSSAAAGREAGLARPDLVGPSWRAAPTRLAASGHAWSRRWLIVVAIVVAGLLAGASVALAATGSGGSAPPVRRPLVSRESQPARDAITVRPVPDNRARAGCRGARTRAVRPALPAGRPPAI